MWFKAGAVSGPAMGAAGAWASRRGRYTVAAIVIATIVLEPLAVYLAYYGSGGFFGAGDGQWNGIYAGESIVGLVAAVVLWRARGVRRRSSTTS
jgi:hypothetical protein